MQNNFQWRRCLIDSAIIFKQHSMKQRCQFLLETVSLLCNSKRLRCAFYGRQGMLIRINEGLFVTDLSRIERGENRWADPEWAGEQD